MCVYNSLYLKYLIYESHLNPSMNSAKTGHDYTLPRVIIKKKYKKSIHLMSASINTNLAQFGQSRDQFSLHNYLVKTMFFPSGQLHFDS